MAESFVFYETFAKQLKLLDKELRYKFYEAIIDYGLYEVEPDFTGLEACAWLPIQEAIDNAKERRIKNIENGKRGGTQKALNAGTKPASQAEQGQRASDAVAKPSDTLAPSSDRPAKPSQPYLDVDVNDNVNVNVNDNVNDIGAKAPEPSGSPAPKRTRFIKPTLADVKAYCEERENRIDPERFINYYEANGWHVGKNPMKDWQAAVRTWEQNSFSSTTRKYNAREPPISAVDDRYDFDAALKAVGVVS